MSIRLHVCIHYVFLFQTTFDLQKTRRDLGANILAALKHA